MNKRIVGAAFLSLSSLTLVSAQTFSYDAAKQAGNQNWTGNLGLDFNVISPIMVSSLGAFDSNGDGFVGSISVAIFNRTTMKEVVGPLTFHGTSATLIDGDRFASLPSPVVLPAGNYSIVAVGFSSSDLNGNSTLSGSTLSTENTGGGLIAFAGTGRYDANPTLDFPTIVPSGTPTNVFLAGTFQFGAGPTGSDTFTPGTDLAVGMYSEAIAVSPLNTSHVSLAVANEGSGNVSVLLGKGNGAFAAAKNYPVGVDPHSLVAGSFASGLTDLAVANVGDNTVSILLANGSGGTFKPAVPYPAGSSPYSIATGLFNNDNNLDLVVANDNLAVSVLLGNGNGTFQLPITHSDPNIAPATLATADFDKDGCLDVAVANPELGTVSILFGNCNGTLQMAVSTPKLFPRPFFIATGNFNGDSFPDVAITDYSGKVYVMTGTGNRGTPLNLPNPAAGYVVGDIPTALTVGDINGDGIADLIVANTFNLNVSVLTGNGDGTFQNVLTYTTPTMESPIEAGLGIFDESAGRTDAAIINFTGPVNILLGKEYTITQMSGEAQIAKSVTSAFPNPLTVTVKSGGTPEVGVPVTFTAPSSGASAIFAGGGNTVTVLTGAGGIAVSPPFTANGIAGSYLITATVGYAASTDPSGTTKFSETN